MVRTPERENGKNFECFAQLIAISTVSDVDPANAIPAITRQMKVSNLHAH